MLWRCPSKSITDQRIPAVIRSDYPVRARSWIFSRAILPAVWCDHSRRPAHGREIFPGLVITLPDIFHAAAYFVDRHIAEHRAERIAIKCGDESISYRHLYERTNRVANALRKLGVRQEERVLLLLLDSPEFLYSFFGAIKLGAVAVPVSTLCKPAEYEYMLNDSRAQILIMH